MRKFSRMRAQVKYHRPGNKPTRHKMMPANREDFPEDPAAERHQKSLPLKETQADIHRMPALLTLNCQCPRILAMPNPRHGGSRAHKPVTSARRAPEMRVSLSSDAPLPWFLIERKTIECFTSMRPPVAAAALRPAAGYRRTEFWG